MRYTNSIWIGCVCAMAYSSCQSANAGFIDLATGDTVMVEQDAETGEMVNSKTQAPVRLYVNMRNNDTIFGTTGEIVNERLRRAGNSYYVFSGDQEYKVDIEDDGDYTIKTTNSDDYKLDVDADGTYKEQIGEDYKIKKTEDEIKIKNGDYKKEIEKDGDVTIKKGDVKIKIDGETGERKVKVKD